MYPQSQFSYNERLDLKQCVNGWHFQTTQQGVPLLHSIQTNYCSYVFSAGKRIGDLGVRYIIANNTYLQPHDRKEKRGARMRILQ